MTIAHATFTEHLTRVLHTINQKRQTGLLSVESVGKQTSEKGEIFFERGETVFARTEQEWGETALGRILNWGEVYYSFFEGVQLPVQHRSLFDLSTAGSIQSSQQTQETVAFTQATSYQALHARLLQARELNKHAEGVTRTPLPAAITIKHTDLPETQQQGAYANKQLASALVRKRETRPLDFREQSSISWEARATTPPPSSTTGPGLEARLSASFTKGPSSSNLENEGLQRGLGTIFRAEPDASVPTIMKQMERRDRVIFLLLNGKRTIPEIACLIHRSEQDIGQSLIKLLRKHYIVAL